MSLDLNKTSNAEKGDEMDTEDVKEKLELPLAEDKEEGELDDEEEDYDDVDEADPDLENKIANKKDEGENSKVENESNHTADSELKETNELLVETLKKIQQEQMSINNETQEKTEVVLATIPPIRSELVEDEYDDEDDYDDEYSLSNKRLKIDEDDSNNMPPMSNPTGEAQASSGEVLVNVLVDSCEASSIESSRVPEASSQMDCDQTLIAQQTVDEKLENPSSTNEQIALITSQNQIDDNKNEAEVEKINSGANQNQMEPDGTSTRSSSSSSALTNISSISSSSSLCKLNEASCEAKSSETPTNQEAEAIDTDSNSNKTVIESGAETTSSTSSTEPKIADSETDTNADKNENKSEESESTTSNKLKVPPLKIICSNPNGGLPYVKSEQLAKQAANANETELVSTPASSITLDMPLTRNKANKARVVSPITTTSANSTLPTRTTPTRRSQLVNNQSSSQVNPTTSQVLNANQGRSSPITNSSTNSNSNTSENALQNGEANGDSAADNLVRRKLRSHTRQLQGGETSASPLTLPSETTPTTSNSQDMSTESSNSNQQQPAKEENNKPNEAFVVNESDTGLKSDSTASTFDTLNTRKRRYRAQQPQPTQTTNNKDSVGDSSEPKSNNQAVASSANQVSNESSQMESTQNNDSSEIQTNSDLNNCSSEINNTNQSAIATNNNNSNVEQMNSESNSITSSVNASNTESILNIKASSCIKKYLEIKNDLLKRRDSLIKTQVQLKYPSNFKEFFLNKKNYLIRQNKDMHQSIPFFKTPNDLHEELKEYFMKQEKERYSLRLRHRVEQDKLSILYEQEILRCFNNFARELNNQTVPLGFCTLFNDNENYSQHNNYLYATEKVKIVNQTNCNANINNDELCPDRVESTVSIAHEEKLVNSLTQTNNKFQKFRDDLIKRQLNESDSLHAVQKMDFQSKYSELSHKHKLASNSQSNANSANKIINTVSSPFMFKQTDMHVPIVHVNSKFELFDLPQLMSCYQHSATTSTNDNNNSTNSV